MPMNTPQELFLHELQDIYDAEHRFLQALPKLAKGCSDERARDAFQQHEQQTKQQIKNLEQVFETLGEKPQRTACYGAQGIVEEQEKFEKKESPAPEILQLFNVGAGIKSEHYEVCSYTDLVEMAQAMGQNEVVKLLQDNLHQEEETAQKLEEISQQLTQQHVKQAATAGA